MTAPPLDDDARMLAARRAVKRHDTRRRRKRQALGLPTTDLVDAVPVRLHIERLRAQGMGVGRIQRAARVAPQTMTHLTCGSNGYPPAQRIRPETAAKLLAVRLDVADRAITRGDLTRQRLRALVAAGWSSRLLAAEMGRSTSVFAQILNGTGGVHGATMRAVAALYGRLREVPPPQSTPAERRAVSIAKGLARRRGWTTDGDAS